MAEAVYILCGLTSLTCAVLLLRGYARSRLRLLLWSGLCFVALTLSNFMLFADLIVFQGIDMSAWRSGLTLAGVATLLYGLIWDAQ